MNSLLIFCTLLLNNFTAVPKHQKTKVAVVEYRAGISEQPNLTNRISSLLKKKSNLKIITRNDARRQMGSKFDSIVSQCQNNTTCFSKLGKKLNVQEVLLVGITEFGTVLINMKRIIVKTSKIKGTSDIDIKKHERISRLQIFGMLKTVFPQKYFIQKGMVHIISETKGAGVFIDNKKQGQTPIKPINLIAPRSYSIKVTKKKFNPFEVSIDLAPDALLRINAQLTPIIKHQPSKWYEKWWVWSIAGAILLGTTAGTLYYFNQPADEVPVYLHP
ncbi:MAG: PEGA domain-containing protein [Deltaproteobacteria bacterium]|jgi:hypothetical protein|nr:PEGA domain-containing protein [Deltaproteobacteria bacterium]